MLLSPATNRSPASRHSLTTSRRFVTAADAAAACTPATPSPAASDVAASYWNAPRLESLAALCARCEGPAGEPWQALVVAFLPEHCPLPPWMAAEAEQGRPPLVTWKLALTLIDNRVRWLAGIAWDASAADSAEALAAAELVVIDEIYLFARRYCAGEISPENSDTEFAPMATKAAPKSAARTSPPPAIETPDVVVERALRYHNWTEHQANGVDDETLRRLIGERLSNVYEKGARRYAFDRKQPAIWFDRVNPGGEPDLEGDELVGMVRKLFSLPQPQQLVEHFDAGKVRHTVEPLDAPAGIEILETKDLDVAAIVRSPYQTRDETEGLEQLVESIKAEGQLTPGLVRRVGDKWELIAGHRRHAALKKLRRTTFRATVAHCDDAAAARIVFLENEKHRPLQPIEKARGLAKIVEAYKAAGRTQAQAAADMQMDPSTLSNLLRSLRMPDPLLARWNAGDFTIEQARDLATWSDYPAVLQGFLAALKNNGLESGPIENRHFESALGNGIERGSRPMAKETHGRGGCLFTPTEAERKDLDIREIKSRWGGTPSKRAFNLKLWNQLQNAAKKKQKEREAKAASKAADGKPKKETRPRDEYHFDRGIMLAWRNAYREAIAARLNGKGKLTKTERTVIARAGLFADAKLTPAKALHMPADQLETVLYDAAVKELNRKLRDIYDRGQFDLDLLRPIAIALGCEAGPCFRLTKTTLEGFGDNDLAKLARQLDESDEGTREQLTARCLAATWPREEVPEILQLEKPKKPKARK